MKLLIIGFLVTTVILAVAVSAEHRNAITNFVVADAALASTELSRWDSATRESFQFVLGFDFLYDLVHNNVAAMLLVWGALRSAQRWAFQLANVFAWVLWLDSALNVLEYFVYRHILATGILEPWHGYGLAIFSFRTSTLIPGGPHRGCHTHQRFLQTLVQLTSRGRGQAARLINSMQATWRRWMVGTPTRSHAPPLEVS